jgi:hypothetical protein
MEKMNELARRPSPGPTAAGSFGWATGREFAISSLVNGVDAIWNVINGTLDGDLRTELAAADNGRVRILAGTRGTIVRCLPWSTCQLNSPAMRVLPAVTCNAMGQPAILCGCQRGYGDWVLLKRIQMIHPCCDNMSPSIVNATGLTFIWDGILVSSWDALLVGVCFHEVCNPTALS